MTTGRRQKIYKRQINVRTKKKMTIFSTVTGSNQQNEEAQGTFPEEEGPEVPAKRKGSRAGAGRRQAGGRASPQRVAPGTGKAGWGQSANQQEDKNHSASRQTKESGLTLRQYEGREVL